MKYLATYWIYWVLTMAIFFLLGMGTGHDVFCKQRHYLYCFDEKTGSWIRCKSGIEQDSKRYLIFDDSGEVQVGK